MNEDTETYERLFNLLTRYISRLMARTIIDRSLERTGITASRLTPDTLLPVVEEARIGIGMFCEPRRLSSLMLDLAHLCGSCVPANGNDYADTTGVRSTVLPPEPVSTRMAASSEPPISGVVSLRAPLSSRQRPSMVRARVAAR